MIKFLNNTLRFAFPIMLLTSSGWVFYSTPLSEVRWSNYFLLFISVTVSIIMIAQACIILFNSEDDTYNAYQIVSDTELPESEDNGNLPETLPLESSNSTANNINELVGICYRASFNGGWHTDRFTGKLLDRNRAEMLCLIHSEISEAMEGERKGLMDDHLPNRPMAEVELADAVIRIADYCGRWGYDLGGAIVEKLAYNATRADHKPENRAQEGGKKF